MAECGIAGIDALLAGRGESLTAGCPDKDAVGAVQDLLACHGAAGLPPILSGTHGDFGPLTTQRVREFQATAGLSATGTVDTPTLKAMIDKRPAAPRISQAYVTLVLDFAYTGTTRLVTITTQFEGGGRFAAENRNTDGAGLSYGLIQWSQKPGRLNELLAAFRKGAPAKYIELMGDGEPAYADALLTHTASKHGGVDKFGRTTDPRFDLIAMPWTAKFSAAALDPALQRIQVSCAMAAFTRSIAALKRYAAPLHSERGMAFMLDLANQHGETGARYIYQTVAPVADEASLLLALENESVRRVEHQFGAGSNEAVATRVRRSAFRTSKLLGDGAFT